MEFTELLNEVKSIKDENLKNEIIGYMFGAENKIHDLSDAAIKYMQNNFDNLEEEGQDKDNYNDLLLDFTCASERLEMLIKETKK